MQCATCTKWAHDAERCCTVCELHHSGVLQGRLQATQQCVVQINPLNANDADRRHRIRKRVSANDAFRRHKLAGAIRVVFLYLRASERNVTLGAPVAVVGPSHSYLIVPSGRTRGAQSSAALCAKFHAVLLD